MTTQTPPDSGAGSWILELRQRLENPPPKGFSSSNGDGGTEKLVALVGLRVESDELWCCFVENEGGDEAIWGECALGFPDATIQAAQDSWLRIADLARTTLEIDSARVLRVGALEVIELADERELQPLVVALPAPEPDAPSPEVAIPITALANPPLVEEQLVEHDGLQIRQQIAHVGRYRLMGPTLWVVESLLLRLGMLDG